MTRPHPFFWLAASLVALGGLASLLTGTSSPSWALNSGLIYHLEIAAAVVVAGYLFAVTLWLAWQGRTFAKVELPIGSVETPDAGALDDAADEFAEFKRATIERLDTVEDAIAALTRR